MNFKKENELVATGVQTKRGLEVNFKPSSRNTFLACPTPVSLSKE
jgi:hypothetical protein